MLAAPAASRGKSEHPSSGLVGPLLDAVDHFLPKPRPTFTLTSDAFFATMCQVYDLTKALIWFRFFCNCEMNRLSPCCGKPTDQPIGLQRIVEPWFRPARRNAGLDGSPAHLAARRVEERQLAAGLFQPAYQPAALRTSRWDRRHGAPAFLFLKMSARYRSLRGRMRGGKRADLLGLCDRRVS